MKNSGFVTFFRHLHTINAHKRRVFRLCVLAGIPFQGLTHDLSKYSPTEFFESVRYYNGGVRSPYAREKNEIGYAPGWLHHKGRNKHHHEYWYDAGSPQKSAPMPFKYFAEMVCDCIGASQNYLGKDFTLASPLAYLERVTVKMPVHPGILAALREVFTELPESGLRETLRKPHLKAIYDRNMLCPQTEGRLLS